VTALAVPRSLDPRYAGSSWPPVVACAFIGCTMRAPADLAPDGWRCSEHRDEWADDPAASIVAAALAEHAHRALTEPPREREDAA
jgi:hypothetical protein